MICVNYLGERHITICGSELHQGVHASYLIIKLQLYNLGSPQLEI